MDTPAVCRTPAPGSTFTMHVRNAGASPLTFSFGCADKPRAYVQTPDGFLRMWWLVNDSGSGVVEEPAGHADRTCENLYTRMPRPFFTDCGTGYGKVLAPGETLDLPWDRRGFISRVADVRCPHEPPVACQFDIECFSQICRAGVCEERCAQALAVPPSKTQSGALVICDQLYDNAIGSCKTARRFDFTFDTTSSEATIDAK